MRAFAPGKRQDTAAPVLVSLLWSFVVSIPCLILALLLVVLGRRERFRQQMRKRLHM